MNNAIFNLSEIKNEPVKQYKAGSKERKALMEEYDRQRSQDIEIPLLIDGKEVRTGRMGKIVIPHDHQTIIGHYHKAGEKEVQMAIDSALRAHKEWEKTSWVDRLSLSLKAAELLSGTWRNKINAATMLNQSKTAHQAEIDAVCETIDFLKFNAKYLTEIYNIQPISDSGIINRIEYRPLEGFVFAISPFNFTSIASNLNMAPVLMGNTTIWKPSATSILSNYYLMQLLMEAGLPNGVINFLPGEGRLIGDIIVKNQHLAGIHFTGSTGTFQHLWTEVGKNISQYKSFPRMVGETGGKDFIFVHESARPDEVATAMVRGAFELQGQKCSAASRAYIPQSLYNPILEHLNRMMQEVKTGDVSNFENFMGAVIDEASFDNIVSYFDKVNASSEASFLFGGKADKTKGYFVEPTIILTGNPHFITMEEEIFGPVLTIYVYPDDDVESTLDLCDNTSPYALTGAIFANDRQFLNYAAEKLKYAAGNLYFNDKPTGAVVGQQPFGGARASGTNDKAGSYLNLLRWVSPRTIKETLTPPRDFKYPFMKEDC